MIETKAYFQQLKSVLRRSMPQSLQVNLAHINSGTTKVEIGSGQWRPAQSGEDAALPNRFTCHAPVDLNERSFGISRPRNESVVFGRLDRGQQAPVSVSFLLAHHAFSLPEGMSVWGDHKNQRSLGGFTGCGKRVDMGVVPVPALAGAEAQH